jgi:hypothetical protein
MMILRTSSSDVSSSIAMDHDSVFCGRRLGERMSIFSHLDKFEQLWALIDCAWHGRGLERVIEVRVVLMGIIFM